MVDTHVMRLLHYPGAHTAPKHNAHNAPSGLGVVGAMEAIEAMLLKVSRLTCLPCLWCSPQQQTPIRFLTLDLAHVEQGMASNT